MHEANQWLQFESARIRRGLLWSTSLDSFRLCGERTARSDRKTPISVGRVSDRGPTVVNEYYDTKRYWLFAKNRTEILPIETDNDLSQYINKKITITSTFEHHNISSSKSNGTVAITDLRLRWVASVIGDCDQTSQ
jgi:hypothetical protein